MRRIEVCDRKLVGRCPGRPLTVCTLKVHNTENVDGAAVWAAVCPGAEGGGIAFDVFHEGGGGGGERSGGEDRDDGGGGEMHGVLVRGELRFG